MTSKITYAVMRIRIRTCRLQALSENSNPVSAQNFFNLVISETALDQFSSEVPRVRMVPQFRNEVRRCKFCSQLFLPRLWPLPVDEFKEIKADPDTVDPDQIHDVVDMIDIVIERAFFFFLADENTVDADNAGPF